MPRIAYWEVMDDLVFKNDLSTEFMSPASQAILRSWGNPLWESTYSSRCEYPMWDRPEIFRNILFSDMRSVYFEKPHIKVPSAVATPSRNLSLQIINRPIHVVMPDYELYHYDVQKVFALFTQFDTLFESQVSSFTSLDVKRTREVLDILWNGGVLNKSSSNFKKDNIFGPIWRLSSHSTSVSAYREGMDALTRVITSGNDDLGPSSTPPGAGARTSLKHNIFAAEVLLRVAESCDNVIGVWGDLFASEALFHVQDPHAKERASHGDGIIVTKNGSIVIIELVGGIMSGRSGFQRIVDKAASWTGVIANSDLDVSVLFIDTTWEKDRREMFNAVDIGIRKESSAYAPNKFMRERAMKKIGIVNASWWFPDDGCISKAGTRLGAYSPTEYKFKEFDKPDPNSSTVQKRLDIITNTISALHTPVWITNDIKDRIFE